MRLRRWQILTVLFLIAGYSGYYLCRSNFSVALPLIISELARRGVPAETARIRLGTIASAGVLAYAIVKFFAGGVADATGGRRTFLGGMLGSVLCTFVFALGGGLPMFTIAWVANRAVQSFGWAGMIRIVARWFPSSSYGTVMGFVSLSFLFGDAASRQFMSVLISNGAGWRGVFFAAGGALLGLLVIGFLMLKETPGDIGEPEPLGQSLLNGEEGSIWKAVLRQPMFWIVCVISVGITLVRETFNLWTPTYFTQMAGMSEAEAAQRSALFPLIGGVSVLLCGYLSDRLGKGARSAIIVVGLILTSMVLVVLGNGTGQPVALTGLVAFLILGPYSYLAGAMSLDLGGKSGGATVSGLIDGSGYLGGVLAGDSMARISVAYGWRGAFWTLAAVSAAMSVAAAVYWRNQRRWPMPGVRSERASAE